MKPYSNQPFGPTYLPYTVGISGKNDFIDQKKSIDCLPVDSNDPLYILHTSGTTGTPKGIVRTNGGHAVALYNSMKMI